MFVASSESLGYSRGGSGKPSCRAPVLVGTTVCVRVCVCVDGQEGGCEGQYVPVFALACLPVHVCGSQCC